MNPEAVGRAGVGLVPEDCVGLPVIIITRHENRGFVNDTNALRESAKKNKDSLNKLNTTMYVFQQ